jgi:hypothetical protein
LPIKGAMNAGLEFKPNISHAIAPNTNPRPTVPYFIQRLSEFIMANILNAFT